MLKKTRMICTCNQISENQIQGAIKNGAHTLSKIFNTTTAGIGECGGSCRPTLQLMLDSYLKTKTFPENPLKSKKLNSSR